MGRGAVRKPASPAFQALRDELAAVTAYVRWLEKHVSQEAADGAAARFARTVRTALDSETLKLSGVSYPGLYARTRYARTRRDSHEQDPMRVSVSVSGDGGGVAWRP